MRLAAQIFVPYALVILVLAGIAAWSLSEVGKLAIEEPTISAGGAEALRSAVSLREAVALSKRLDMRSLIFDNSEYSTASSEQGARVTQEFARLGDLVKTDEEKSLLNKAATGYTEYHATVDRIRGLARTPDARRAEKLFHADADPAVARVVASLDRLVGLTRDGLDQSQRDATAVLEKARIEIEALRVRTWKAVTAAMIVAVLAALLGTAVIAIRMTRSLSRLSDATRAVAEGQFHEPLNIDAKDEIGALARSFNTMAARLREIDAMKEKFYATVSHELRSPLNAMREAVRLIEAKNAGPLTEKQERLIAILEKGCERLLRLVNSVLDLSRAESGMMPIEPRWFGLDAAIMHAIDELRLQAEHRGIVLRAEIGSAPARMLGDQDRIVQVVVNLVANALRFTPAGGIVTVRLEHTPSEIHMQVEDTGIGIPAAMLPVIFNRFRQAHSGKGGTGLGLAIVKSLVDAHEGRVTVESEEGKGSRFTVILPRQTASLVAIDAEALTA